MSEIITQETRFDDPDIEMDLEVMDTRDFERKVGVKGSGEGALVTSVVAYDLPRLEPEEADKISRNLFASAEQAAQFNASSSYYSDNTNLLERRLNSLESSGRLAKLDAADGLSLILTELSRDAPPLK